MASSLWRGGAAALLLAAGGAGAAQADDAAERWRFGEGEGGSATAALLATSKLNTGGGALSYSPVLTIGCRPGADPQWREWLTLSDKVATSGTIAMRVTVDARSFDESWKVEKGGKVLSRSGADAVGRLAQAGRLLLSWRFGLLSGRGTADFDLAGAAAALGRLADTCGTEMPG